MHVAWAISSSAAAGSVAGLVAAGGLLATNCGQLLTLIQHDPQGWIMALLLTGGLATLFALAAGMVTALNTEA